MNSTLTGLLGEMTTAGAVPAATAAPIGKVAPRATKDSKFSRFKRRPRTMAERLTGNSEEDSESIIPDDAKEVDGTPTEIKRQQQFNPASANQASGPTLNDQDLSRIADLVVQKLQPQLNTLFQQQSVKGMGGGIAPQVGDQLPPALPPPPPPEPTVIVVAPPPADAQPATPAPQPAPAKPSTLRDPIASWLIGKKSSQTSESSMGSLPGIPSISESASSAPIIDSSNTSDSSVERSLGQGQEMPRPVEGQPGKIFGAFMRFTKLNVS